VLDPSYNLERTRREDDMQHEIDRRLLLGGAGALGVAATSALAQEAKPVA
jgi:hypothetical protein